MVQVNTAQEKGSLLLRGTRLTVRWRAREALSEARELGGHASDGAPVLACTACLFERLLGELDRVADGIRLALPIRDTRVVPARPVLADLGSLSIEHMFAHRDKGRDEPRRNPGSAQGTRAGAADAGAKTLARHRTAGSRAL